jgi:putative transposase
LLSLGLDENNSLRLERKSRWNVAMPNDRRAYVPGGSFFFTLVTDRRAPLFCGRPGRPLIGSMLRRAQLKLPFTINAIVLLPEHLHAIWSLPSGDTAYSARWGWIKKEFSKVWLELGGAEQPVSAGRERERRRGVWQRRFWEHTLESEDDFERNFDYIHYNTVFIETR